jgi:RND family efflux transporter MFP subunit
VKEVHVDLGDKVEAGQVLITLDVPEMEVELAQKEALVDQARAEIRQSEAALAAAEAAADTAAAQVRQAQAGIARAAADVARWRSEFARLEELASGGSINKQLVDETRQKLAAAEAAHTESEAAVASAEAMAAQAKAGIEKAKADIVAAAARERVAAANVQHAQTLLDYAQIKAPYTGVVTRRAVDPGYFLLPAGAEAAPLLRVARTDIIRVFVAVPELESGQVDIGDAASVHVQSLGSTEFKGSVSRTAWSLDESSRALVAVIDLDNAEGRMRPGMYATARILLAERPDALVLPSAAVVRKDNTAHCFVVEGAKVRRTPIELGIKVGDDWEITSGLAGNDTVCLTKAATLQDGQQVDAATPPPAK